MKKVLILPGWHQKTSSNWYPWLAKALKDRGYEVTLPDLPTIHDDFPNMKKMLDLIDGLLDIDRETIVIGHSLGCLLAMRIAEYRKYKKMILIAGWDFNDLTEEHRLFWEKPINHAKINENVKVIYCVSSDNDPYCTYFVNEQMSKRLNGKSILVKGAGHFTEEFGITEIPQLLDLI